MSDPGTLSDVGRREQAKADRRLKIVRAARDLIRETGDTNLSMRMIAQRAEVSVATPYNLFGSKRAVVMAVLEDERDFLDRFHSLKVDNAIDRFFEAHALGASYFVQDPDFYRPLWKALLDTNGEDNTGLATPERQEQTRAAWRWLLSAAQDEGLLDTSTPVEVLERTLSHLGNGVMLSWAMGTLPTHELLPSASLGYALILSSSATAAGRPILERQIARHRQALSAASPG
ncbi:MAG: TetR/AcrR family transcriptional regulator [Hyphomonas sp.]|jgi:AcrR family transcriptional regulator|nr:TetR/AcrR family transcriptional regulator [Hyphomonas sp.]